MIKIEHLLSCKDKKKSQVPSSGFDGLTLRIIGIRHRRDPVLQPCVLQQVNSRLSDQLRTAVSQYEDREQQDAPQDDLLAEVIGEVMRLASTLREVGSAAGQRTAKRRDDPKKDQTYLRVFKKDEGRPANRKKYDHALRIFKRGGEGVEKRAAGSSEEARKRYQQLYEQAADLNDSLEEALRGAANLPKGLSKQMIIKILRMRNKSLKRFL